MQGVVNIDWNNAPSWAKFHTIDPNGQGLWFEYKPYFLWEQRRWVRQLPSYEVAKSKKFEEISIDESKQTLTQRP